MCGIAGVMHADLSRAVDAQILANMAAIQWHRGPDGFGVKTMSDRGIGFGHARLSIIDLDEDRGRQPFMSKNGNLMLTQNGELYDYKRIRADLTTRGAQFQSKSDSELVIHLYDRFGLEEALTHCRGEFAFALYDKQKDRLMLVRDRFGIKPLYWTQTDDAIVFGSELKVLFAHPEVSRKFSAEGVYHQLMQTMVPGTTAFEGVHQVKPGHIVTIERDGKGGFVIEDTKYWDMDYPKIGERDESQPEEFYIEAVREKLLEAVQLRLEADVPVGCYLSGGIDSCSAIGMASATQQSPVKAFTIGFDDADYDESVIAQEMSASVNADHDIMRLNADHLYDHFEETLWHTERTIYNTLGVAKMLMSRHVNEAGYKVVVTGEGSDELFSGYPAFRRDMFLHGMESLSPDERQEWEAILAESNKLFKGAMLAENELHDTDLDKLIGFTPSCLQPWLRAAEHVPSLLHPDLRAQTEGYQPGKAIADALDGDMLNDRHPLDKTQYVWIKTMLEGQILTWGGDRVDMANSMEARPPFLDHHLAELATQLPPSVRIKGKTEKYVLREAMKGLLPKTLYEREKFAFMAPPAHTDPKKWDAMMKLADKYLSDEAIDAAGLLDKQSVKAIFDLHEDDNTEVAKKVQLDAVINHMIGVQVLHAHFVAQDVPALAAKEAERLGWMVH